MGDDSELQLVDLELEDEVIKGVKVIDPPIKGTKNLDHGLPEHQWCPKKEHIIDPDEEKTKVGRVKKYFWSKRSSHYLAMKAQAKKEREMQKSSPRQILSIMAKDCALREVLQRVGINDYDMKLNDEEFASGIAGITECYLYVFGFFALTFLMATILFFLLGEESAMIGILFF